MLKLKNKLFLFVMVLFALVGLASCTGVGLTSIEIRFEQDVVYVRQGGSIKLAPQITKGEQVGTVNLIWSSADEEIATVENGVVTGNALGEVVIKAILEGNIVNYDKITVIVVETLLPDLNVVNAKDQLYKGEEHKLVVALAEQDGATAESTVSWRSSNEEVATVSEEGLVVALAAGKTTLIATVSNGDESQEYEYELEVLETDFSIKYNLDGGVNGENPETFNIHNLPLELKPATKEGYEFLGWYIGEELVTEIAEGTAENVELTAKWRKLEYSLSFDLDGGSIEAQADLSQAEVKEEFNLSHYISYNVNGYNASLYFKSNLTWWSYVVLQETEVKGIYEIVEIVAGSKKITKEFDAVITWHSDNKEDNKAVLDKMYNNASSYVGDYVVFENVPEAASKEANITTKVLAAESVKFASVPEKYSAGEELELPAPTKLGYDFLGWYAGETKVEKITAETKGDLELVAKWELAKYDVKFDLDGGKFGLTIDEFAEQIVALFNASDESGSKVLTKETFHSNSHPNIKGVFNKAENLEAYKWLFEFVKAEITNINATNGYVVETVEMLDKMIAGDTTAIGSSSYANGRTLFRHFVHNVINKNHEAVNSAYTALIPDFSLEENQAKFLAAMNGVQTVFHYGDTLPTPSKEGYNFLGWYVGETKVETVTGDLEVTAKWEEIYVAPTKYNLTLYLNSGVLENIPTEYEVATGLVLPVPTREGFEFLGWFDNAELTGEAVEKIAADSTGDKVFYAKWAEKVVEPEDGEFEITYELEGGQWPQEKVDSYEKFRDAILSDFEAYFSKIAGKEVTLNRVSENTDPNPDNWHVTDFMGVSYGYRDHIEAFFTTEEPYATKWGWVFDQLKADGIEADTAWSGYRSTVLRGWTHGFIYQTKYDKWPKGNDYSNNTFDLIEDKVNITIEYPGETVYDSRVGLVLKEVSKEGYKFLGWELNGEIVTEIKAGTKGNVTLTAKFMKEGAALEVGADKEYKKLADALAAAKEGDTIILDAGEYEGVEIKVNYLTLKGANAGINPVTETRSAESVFLSDLVISADNVVVDGIQITGEARIKGGDKGCENVTIQNVWAKGSTMNPDSSASNNAPFYFSSVTEGVEYKNLTLLQVKMSDREDGRPMAAYFDQVNGITIKDSSFVGKRSNYNDAVKFGNTAGKQFGVKGEVQIIGNHFENFAQYVLWFLDYQEGNYVIENNTFLNNGQTSSAHNAARFASYSGADNGVSSIQFNYNTVDNSYMLIRIDAVASRTATTQPVKVNYNKLLNCGATYYVKNSNGYNIDATNNYYDKAPNAGLFLNATWEPYYTDESKVPAYGQDLSFGLIEYELNGGELQGTAPEQFDVNTGLAKLPEAAKEGYEFLGWELNGELVTEIAAGTTGKVVLVAKFKEIGLYVGQGGDYATLAEALAAAKPGDKIIILAGEYEENVTISIADLTIKGPNAGISAVNGTRVAEAIIKGVISINATATGLTIDGLAFTGAGQVKAAENTGTYEGFAFLNNKVYDTNASETPWVPASRYAMNAAVEFKLSSGGKCLNFLFFNNSFENVDAVNLLINRARNLSVDGNLFKDFGQDAIRIEGGYATGILAFTNNKFEQTTVGHGFNAIYLYSGSGPDGDTDVIVENNVFKQIGQANSEPFHGTISANVYQEYPLTWNITNNVFDHCYDYMWLRNNGADASIWSCSVENNQFLGLPNSFYFGTYRGSDTQSTNPHLAVFGANYYEDNNGNVITDLSAHADMFKHLASYGTALAAKPGENVAEKYEFWTISYELGGGQAKGLVTEYNKDTGAIALPTPTWNIYHEFKQWTLDGKAITEIPADARGDLVIVAEWTEIEGNPVTLNFELNGGNWRYSSFADISADLLADYNAYGGTNYTAETLPTGAWVNINIHNFYYSEGMSEKWAWLAGWLGEVGGSANKPGCKALLDYTDAASFAAKNGNYPYEVSYEFRAIMRGSSITSNASYKTPDYSEASLNEQIWAPLVLAQKSTLETTEGKILTLPVAHKQYLSFVGWYDNAEFTGEPVTEITVGATNPTYYAKYIDLNPVTEIKVANAITTMKRYETHQLIWEVLPAAAANKAVIFSSSDSKVISVDPQGLLTAVAGGTATITITSAANEAVVATLEITVTVPTLIEGEYETTSYVEVGKDITLNATVANGEGTIVWSSADESVATVANGVVTGKKAGTVLITAKLAENESVKVDFFVTVLDGETSELLAFILGNHNANIFTSYDLGIGSGTPAYYSDIYSSVSKILMNHDLYIDETYLDKGNASGDYYENAHLDARYGGIQFVTFHYTAGMGATADTDNHASYFTGGSADVSIHYITGNKGSDSNGATSEVYKTLDHAHGAWHAGDSNSRYYSNSTLTDESGLKRFQWIPTGVQYDGTDLLDIKWTASDDFYFEINGKKTTIKLPDTYNYKERNTNHIYNADGTISSQDSFTFSWAKFSNRTPESFFNDQGFAVNVIDGQYYMGPTWWSYGQVVEGRICAVGGNQNSIGIESCVNEGSDLWLTWQISAQLIAKLLNDNGLTIDRVKGHHFFDGKDCPQPLLENDLAIWYEFIELIKAELEIITTYKDYEIKFVSHNTELVDEMGRVVKAPEFAQSVSYTVTVEKDGQVVEEITLGSLLPGIYEKK